MKILVFKYCRWIRHNETFSLLSDNDNIWVGTFGGGVSYLNDDQWFTLDTKDGLIGNTVGSIRVKR